MSAATTTTTTTTVTTTTTATTTAAAPQTQPYAVGHAGGPSRHTIVQAEDVNAPGSGRSGWQQMFTFHA